jgi:hypothetical protein
VPLGGSFGSEDPQCGSRDEVALQVEGVLDGGGLFLGLALLRFRKVSAAVM